LHPKQNAFVHSCVSVYAVSALLGYGCLSLADLDPALGWLAMVLLGIGGNLALAYLNMDLARFVLDDPADAKVAFGVSIFAQPLVAIYLVVQDVQREHARWSDVLRPRAAADAGPQGPMGRGRHYLELVTSNASMLRGEHVAEPFQGGWVLHGTSAQGLGVAVLFSLDNARSIPYLDSGARLRVTADVVRFDPTSGITTLAAEGPPRMRNVG